MKIYTPSEGSTPDLETYRDRQGFIKVDDLRVEVKVTDARLRFGHLDLLVTPVAGSGERWVEQHRVDLPEAAKSYVFTEATESHPFPV